MAVSHNHPCTRILRSLLAGTLLHARSATPDAPDKPGGGKSEVQHVTAFSYPC